MKQLLLIITFLFQMPVYGQETVSISFKNDYQDVYHLSLIIYTPDGKNQTRVSNLNPNQIKTYSLPVGTEIYVADWKQEAFAMKGNDIKRTGLKPTFVLTASSDKETVVLSTLSNNKSKPNQTQKKIKG